MQTLDRLEACAEHRRHGSWDITAEGIRQIVGGRNTDRGLCMSWELKKERGSGSVRFLHHLIYQLAVVCKVEQNKETKKDTFILCGTSRS
jgi:hypothetical protein